MFRHGTGTTEDMKQCYQKYFSDFDVVTENLINDLWSVEPFPILLVTFNDCEVYFMGFKMKIAEKEIL